MGWINETLINFKRYAFQMRLTVKCIENVVESLHLVLVSFDRGDLRGRIGFLAKGERRVHDESRQGSLWEINQQPLEFFWISYWYFFFRFHNKVFWISHWNFLTRVLVGDQPTTVGNSPTQILSSIFHPAWRNILMDAFPVSSADLAFLVSWFYHLIPM